MTALVVSASPSSTSRTLRLSALVAERLAACGVTAPVLDLRALPAQALLAADVSDPDIAAAAQLVAGSTGIVIASPVYKAAYSGLLKTFLDLLPQFGLRGKVVLPLATGGSLAHVLAIDYALRPVLSSLDPLHVVGGLFIVDQQIAVRADGRAELSPEPSSKLDVAIAAFVAALQRAAPPAGG